MDSLSFKGRQHAWFALMSIVLFTYVFFSPNLDRYFLFVYFNQALSHLTIFYFNYIGTNKVYAYFFIVLLTYVVCQWHLSHYRANKILFIALSMAVSVIMVQCAAVFFSHYVEHIRLNSTLDDIQLIHNSVNSIPGGHIIRLVTLTTCLCFLIQKRWLQVSLITITTLILMGMGITFYDRVFISTGFVGVITGFCVPYYLRILLFTQNGTQKQSTKQSLKRTM